MRIPLGVEPKFGSFVRQLETWAAAHPSSYRFMVFLLALSGYGYLLGLLLIVVVAALTVLYEALVMVYMPWIGLLGPFLVLGGIILRALWLRLEPPSGYQVTRETAPKLFAVLDKVRRAAGGPQLDRVLITNEFNADVTQIPRLGVLGWNRNYLTIGLPLMQSVSEEEFTAVLAHEYGHLAGNHGWFGSWIYRLRMAWWRIAFMLQFQARWSRWLFKPFYVLYVPRFNAYSFVLARADEYEADQMSVEIAGASSAASALARVATVGHYVSARFWPSLLKTANNHREPPYLPMARLREEFGKPLAPSILSEGFNLALARSTDLSDTHPSLQDRLRGIGATAAPVTTIESSAADQLFDPELLRKIVESLDAEWRWAALEAWKNHYEQSRQDRQLLNDLTGKVKYGTPTPQERLQRAELTEQFLGEDEALPLYHEIVADDPANAAAKFALGRILLTRNDAEGLPFLEAAMAIDDRLTMAGCELAYLYLMRIGRGPEAETYRLRLVRQQELEERAAEERTAPRQRDRYDKHGLSADEVKQFVDRLQANHAVRQAYLVRKRVSFLPHRPYYLLAVRSTTRADQMDYSLAQALASTLKFPGDADAYVILITWRTHWLLWRLRRMPTALILSKG